MVEKDGIYRSENGKSCFKIDATGTLIECDQSGKSLAEEKKKETDAEKDEKLEERTKNINKIFTDLQSKFPEGTKVEIPNYQEPDFRQWQLTRGDQSCRLKIGSDIPGELSIEVSQRLREGNVLNQFFPKYTFTLNDTNKVIQKINNYLLTDAEKGKDDLGAKMPALSDILQRDLTNADQEALNSMQTEIQKLEPDQIIILLEKLEVKKSQLQWASQMYIDIIEKNQEKDIRLLLLYLVANHETPMGDGINVAKVKAEIGRFCTEKPTDISVRYLGAKCFLIIQEKDAAIKLLKEGLVLKSAACGIGLCQLLKEDNLDEAKTALDQAKQYSPSDKEAEEIKKLESEINEKKERVKNINKIFTNLQPRFPKGTVFVEQNDPYAQLIRWELTRGGQSCWLDIDIAINGSVIMNVIVKKDKGRFAISYVNETDKVINKIEEYLLTDAEKNPTTPPPTIPTEEGETDDEKVPMPRDPNKSTEKTLSTEVATRLLKENPVFIDLSSVTEPLSAEVAEIIASKGTKVALNGLTSMTPEIAKILPNLAELSLNGLTELPSDLATALGEFTGYKLSLDGLTSLNADQATALSGIPHDLSLNGLSSLESDVVKIFKEAGTFLSLNGIKELTPTLIADFEKYDSCLSFGGLTFLTESEARGLVAMNSYLSLNGINVAFLTPNVARELAKNNSSLELNGLTSLPDGVAAELKKLKTDVSLSLSKLDTISAEDAKSLASVSRPSLNLGITSLDEDAATALAPFAGEYLGLDNLTEKTLTPEVLRHFKDFKGGQLSLEGLESISIDLANALVEIPGTVILTGITDVSDDIGKILAKKGESLYMSDHMSEEKRTQYKFGGGGSFF